MLVAGLGLMGQTAWAYLGSDKIAKEKQEETVSDLRASWAEKKSSPTPTVKEPLPVVPQPRKTSLAKQKPKPAPKPAVVEPAPLPDSAFALVRIPRLGGEYEVPLVKGVGEKALELGIGWLPTSAKPGAKGNMVLSGHRVTHGSPFRMFENLQKGDAIVIETEKRIYTYLLEEDGGDRIVDVKDYWITDPVPGKNPKTKPSEALITLVTCTDLYATDRRSVVVGKLYTVENKEEAKP